MGNARIASVTVTAAAIVTVRNATVRYTDSVTIVLKFPRLKVCDTSPVSAFTFQNAAASSTASEPR